MTSMVLPLNGGPQFLVTYIKKLYKCYWFGGHTARSGQLCENPQSVLCLRAIKGTTKERKTWYEEQKHACLKNMATEYNCYNYYFWTLSITLALI